MLKHACFIHNALFASRLNCFWPSRYQRLKITSFACISLQMFIVVQLIGCLCSIIINRLFYCLL